MLWLLLSVLAVEDGKPCIGFLSGWRRRSRVGWRRGQGTEQAATVAGIAHAVAVAWPAAERDDAFKRGP